MIGFLRGLLRVLVALFVVRLALRAIASFLRPRRAEPRPAPALAPQELVRDHVCNTFVPAPRAVRAIVAGREEAFCSTGCRDKALAAVQRAS